MCLPRTVALALPFTGPRTHSTNHRFGKLRSKSGTQYGSGFYTTLQTVIIEGRRIDAYGVLVTCTETRCVPIIVHGPGPVDL